MSYIRELTVQWVNSLWPSDIIWWHRPGLTLVQLMAWKSLPVPMLIVINDTCWHLAGGTLTKTVWYITHYKLFVNDILENIATSPMGQRVDTLWSQQQLDMSTARRRLKSPQSLYSTSTHHGYPEVMVMVMNDRLASLSFHVNQVPHSSNKAISNFDLETARSRSWVWSKGKTMQST